MFVSEKATSKIRCKKNFSSIDLYFGERTTGTDGTKQITDWTEIIARYGPVVWLTVNRLVPNVADSEDCFQKAFVSAWEYSQTHTVRDWPSLLRHMATSRALERGRELARQRSRLTKWPAEGIIDSRALSPVEQANVTDLEELLRRALAAGTKYRLEHSSGIVIVGDRDSRKRLLYDSNNKSTGVFDLNEHAVAELGTGIVEQLRQVRPDEVEPIGKETIDGKSVDVFLVNGIKLFGVDSSKGAMKICVDPKSMLPWRIDLLVGKSSLVSLRDLTWNIHVDSASLQIQIPDGYSEQSE